MKTKFGFGCFHIHLLWTVGGSKAGLLTPAKQTGSSNTTPSSSPLQVTLNSRPPLALMRPKVNSILHLFGSWLVEAALAGVKVFGSEQVGELNTEVTASSVEIVSEDQ